MGDMETKTLILDHIHPMTLKTKSKTLQLIDCHVCGKWVFEDAYFCRECNILLHTECSKLTLQVTHPMHPEHTLDLKYESPLREEPKLHYYCNTCRNRLPKRFIYVCLPCKFHICASCAVDISKERIVTHEGHQHPLLRITRKAYFLCDACDGLSHGHGSSYMCITCPFWIEDICASLESTIKVTHHNHSLSLAYCVPQEFRHYDPYCEICFWRLKPLMWVYFCGRCRYFIHTKCFRDTEPSRRSSRALGDVAMGDLIQLPWKDMSMDVIKHFLENKSQTQIQPSNQIMHFSHEHPLNLSGSGVNGNGEEMLCDGCVEPIYTPSYYSCDECRYVLHTYCAHLPKQLQLPTHPDHQLVLKNLSHDHGYFYCKSCHTKSNGFFFECEACDFQIDLNCAVLPLIISHEAHDQHPLIQRVRLPKYPSQRPCNACGKKMSGLGYCCGRCIGFYIHYHCAILPPSAKHRWDKHQLKLMYPPFGDHPDEMYCEICEEEIHPKHWMYHCRECDQSFHPFCIPQIGKDRHIKFGDTVQVHDHQHLLTSVREGIFKSKCARCGNNLSNRKAFECGPCRFSLCYECVRYIPPEPGETIILPGQEVQEDDFMAPWPALTFETRTK